MRIISFQVPHDGVRARCASGVRTLVVSLIVANIQSTQKRGVGRDFTTARRSMAARVAAKERCGAMGDNDFYLPVTNW